MNDTPDDGTAPTPPDPDPRQERCCAAELVVDGRPVTVVVHGEQPLGAADRAALGHLAEAALALADQRDPNWAARQELLRATRIALRCIPDGPIHSFPRDRDGSTVKADLNRAVRAVLDLLSPDPPSGSSP